MLKDFFDTYGGDYEETMRRFMGDEALYCRMLPGVFTDDALQKLGSALARRDLDGAFAAAHTMKGVFGNLGLTPLYEAVCALVEPLRAQDPAADYASMYQAIEREFQRLEEVWAQVTAEHKTM